MVAAGSVEKDDLVGIGADIAADLGTLGQNDEVTKIPTCPASLEKTLVYPYASFSQFNVCCLSD